MNFESLFAGKTAIEAIIVINAEPLPSCLPSLWQNAKLKICADGGADLLLKAFGTTLRPDLILGDLDSLSTATRQVWENEGVPIERETDQDSTDLEKCLRRVPSTNMPVVVAGGVGGRLDQTLGVINCVYKEAIECRRNTILLGGETVAVVIPGGTETKMTFPRSLIGSHCGLVPLFGKSDNVTTRGLKWELCNQPTGFGGLISTSNLLDSTDLEIVTSQPLLWTLSSDL